MKQFLSDVLFPKKCVGCKKIGSFLCPDCFSRISFYTANVCPMCLKSSIDGATHPVCRTPHGLDGLASGVVYSGVVKRLLYQFKYSPFVSELKKIIGKLLEESLLQNEAYMNVLRASPLAIPIPLYKKKERARGYNHAALLARHVVQYFSLKSIENGLIRVKDTQPQFKLNPAARAENIIGAFRLNSDARELIQNKTILVVDDLATTATTLREAAKVLKRAGAKSVWGVTFAKEL